MSDKTNDEIRDLLAEIKKSSAQAGGDVRQWSHEDIDRLLQRTGREDNIESIAVDNAPETYKHYVDDASMSATRPIDTERIRSIMEDEQTAAVTKPNLSEIIGGTKLKLASVFGGIKAKAEKLTRPEKEEKIDDRFILEDDEDEDIEVAEDEKDTEENVLVYNIDDGKTKQMPIVEKNSLIDEPTQTIYIEKPGVLIKKGEASEDSDLNGAPVIMPADDAIDETGKFDSTMKRKLREAEEDGQIVFSGFDESMPDEPEKISEADAEQELFKKRREKIRKFTLFGEEEGNDLYSLESNREKLDGLFEIPEEEPKQKDNEDFFGVEYTQLKDARRIRKYLISQAKRSKRRLAAQMALLFASIVLGIVSASTTTVAGDKFLTIFFNLVIITLSFAVSNQSIMATVENLKKKKFNINSATSMAAILCFAQSILMLILYFFHMNTVSVFASAGVTMLAVTELSNYLVNHRTYDAIELCTGKNQDRLYSIEAINDDKDITELGKNVRAKSPRIRYSSRISFPSHLVELCTAETTPDKRIKLFAPLTLLLGIINLAVAWAVNGSFAVGFAAFTATAVLCIPFGSVLLIQFPLSIVNRQLNKMGGMISCQNSVDELCKTNAIVVDSQDLFDRKRCEMLGFKDLKTVRMDDAMLYSAAMAIRSGGPLVGVFDQMVSNRRDILPTVKSFSYEEKMGVSGWINGQKVILGNRALMVNHNIDLPVELDEDKYLINNHEVLYLAIAHKPAAMIVVNYAPDMRLKPYLKRLRDSGVTILVRNSDPNVTEHMISSCYDMRLDNIKILSSNAGRVFKKYKSRRKLSAKALTLHNGTAYSLFRTLCTAAMLRHVFKIVNSLMFIGELAGFIIMLILSIMNVVADLPAIFVIMIQILLIGAFAGTVRVGCSK